eukprot:scaffold256444_cov32-Tisochrysis_lutea.AAC.2
MNIFAERDGVRIGPSPGKGFGVFATRRLPAEATVGDYVGEQLTQREVDARYSQTCELDDSDREWLESRRRRGVSCTGNCVQRICHATSTSSMQCMQLVAVRIPAPSDLQTPRPGSTDLFKLSGNCFIDSEDPAVATWTRYLNHGTPNLRVKSLERGYDGSPRVWFVATRDIDPGDELLWDYGEDYWFEDDTIA